MIGATRWTSVESAADRLETSPHFEQGLLETVRVTSEMKGGGVACIKAPPRLHAANGRRISGLGKNRASWLRSFCVEDASASSRCGAAFRRDHAREHPEALRKSRRILLVRIPS